MKYQQIPHSETVESAENRDAPPTLNGAYMGLYGFVCLFLFFFFLPRLVAMILNGEGCGRPRYQRFLLSLEGPSIKKFNRSLAV